MSFPPATYHETSSSGRHITSPEYSESYELYPTYDYDSNSMPCNKEEIRAFSKLLLPVVYSLICIVGFVGNIFVVLTFTFYKRTKSMTDIYLLNMAVADILFVLTIPFWTVYRAKEWIFGDFMCKLVQSVYKINFNCSMLLLACIGIDRYIAIVQATRSFRCRAIMLTYKRIICVFVWIFSVLLTSVTYIFNTVYPHNNINGIKWVCEPQYKIEAAGTWKILSLSTQVLLGFLLPFLIMVFCYSLIVKTLLQAHNSQRHKAIRVVIAVVVVFLVCQIPYNIVIIVKAAKLSNECADQKLLAYAQLITEALAFLHCCLNPALYAFVGVEFRNYFLKIMRDIWCSSKKYMTGRSSLRLSSDVYLSRGTSEVYDDRHISSFTM
ncbi:C-C chemokine receptor type 6 [Lissotriton helveticus]